MKIHTYIVDSFTEESFKGNPAGVCLVDEELNDDKMLLIAQELNLSETAFVQKDKMAQHYSIRYFSPKMEIPLCGHATLAAAKVLLHKSQSPFVHFTTIQNIELIISQSEDRLIMEFPGYNTVAYDVSESMLSALGIDEVVNCEFNEDYKILLLEIGDQHTLRNLSPDFEALVKSSDELNGVCITALSDDEYDFHSRYFWPWSGTNEDPVTGGTHTFLAGYWASRLNKRKLIAFQSSARTGFMELELINDDRLLIKGNAVVVLEGHLNV